LHEQPGHRLANFDVVLQRLAALEAPAVAQLVPEALPVEAAPRRDDWRRRQQDEAAERRRQRQEKTARWREQRAAADRERERRSLPRWLSATLGAVFLTATLGLGFALDMMNMPSVS